MTTTCTNPNCSISLAPGATTCWLCGAKVGSAISAEENAVLGAYNSSRARRGARSLCVSEYVADAQTRNDVRAIMDAARAPLVAEVARLRAQFEAEFEAAESFRKERDDLRAKLEAAERAAKDLDERLHGSQIEASTAWSEVERVKAERRGAVDRERAIEAATARLWGMRLDRPADEIAREVVNAILGAAKEPANPPAFVPSPGKKGVRQAMEMAAKRFGGSDGMFTLANLSHALMESSGMNSLTDGLLLRTILADRDDVESCEPGNPKCAHYRIKQAAFVPSPTGAEPSEELVKRMNDVITHARDIGRAVYALIAADHAAQAQRVRELEGMVTTEHDNACAAAHENVRLQEEVERLQAEVERLKAAASKPCPADGMSDRELGDALNDASVGGIVENWREAVGKLARELFGKGKV